MATGMDLPVTIGGEVRDFSPGEYIVPKKRIKLMCREIQMGCAVASLAAKDAGLEKHAVDPDRVGVVFGGEIYHGPIDDAAEGVPSLHR